MATPSRSVVADDPHYYEQKLSLDKMLQKFQGFRDHLVSLIESDLPEITVSDIIDYDPFCVTSMGRGDPKSMQRCFTCHQMSNLTELKPDISRIKLAVGVKKGQEFTVEENRDPFLLLEYQKGKKARLVELDRRFPALKSCGFAKGYQQVENYLVSSTWLNGVLIGIYLDAVTKFRVASYERAFVCNERGYRLALNYQPLKSLNKLSVTDAEGIVVQLAHFYESVQGLHLVHGASTIKNLYLEPIKYEFDQAGKEYTASFSIRIGQFDMASIQVGDTRIIPSSLNRDVDIEIALRNFDTEFRVVDVPLTDKPECDQYFCSRSKKRNMFYVKSESDVMFTVSRYSGYPIFGGAYDVYSFLVSLMSFKPFRVAAIKSKFLMKLWNNIFYGDPPEIKELEESIVCCYKINKYLKERLLYCDAQGYLIKMCR